MGRRVISYIFPVYNNAPSLQVLYDAMRAEMAKLKSKYDYEFVFVNDGSRDDSIATLRKLAQKDSKVTVLNLSRNFGHQAAVTAGLDYVSGDAVIIMDADMQDPPGVCPKLIARWEKGYEIVYAQRRTRKDSLIKKLTANVFYRILSALSSVDIPRNTGDFRLIDRKVVNVVRQMKEHNRFLRGMYAYAGFKSVGVLFDRHPRFAGKSEYTVKKLMKLAKDGIFSFSDLPLVLVTRFGFFVSLLSVIGIIYAITLKIVAPEIAIPGWTMTVVAIFFMGGVQLIMLGVLGEYIGRIYGEVRNRPNYIVAEEIRKETQS
jgi:polyisoprenyl-phosphate glycosyltransferase